MQRPEQGNRLNIVNNRDRLRYLSLINEVILLIIGELSVCMCAWRERERETWRIAFAFSKIALTWTVAGAPDGAVDLAVMVGLRLKD